MVAIAFGGCGNDTSDHPTAVAAGGAEALRIGHFDFPESALLAELYSQALTTAGVPNRIVDAPGTREVLGPALEQDRLDLVPEYLGTATRWYGQGETEQGRATPADLRAGLEPHGLAALEPAAAENTNVFAVRADSGLGPRLSDLAGVSTGLRFGGLAECPDRPLCLAGLGEVYGLTFGEFVPQPTVATTAEALSRGEIDIGLLFSTDAGVSGDLLVLDDDRHLQPPENIVPVIRTDALQRWDDATVRAALDAVSANLDTQTLRELNRRLAASGDRAGVASEWLASVISTID